MWIWVLWVVGALGVASVKAQGALESPELAWLLANEAPPPPLSLRHITPKSVFLAPTFTSCSEGYRQDPLGRCVKVVKINQQAQWEFLLKKLNSMYAPPPREKQPTGPFRLPIPFETEAVTTTLSPTTTTEEGSTSPSTISPSTAPPTTTTTTEQAEATETTPLVIVVANSTDLTTERDWQSTTVSPEYTGKTSTEFSTPMMTTTASSAADCEDCYSSATNNYRPYTYSAPVDYFTVATRASELRPTSSSRPPAAPDIHEGYPPARPQSSSPRPAIYQQRTTEENFFQIPTVTTTPTQPSETYYPPFRQEYTTRRTTVRFPSERPPIVSHGGLQYVRFPTSQLSSDQSPIWWPPAWDPSLWPQRQAKPWGHREPRPSWTHQ